MKSLYCLAGVALMSVAALIMVPHYTSENWWYLIIHFMAWYAAGLWQGLLVKPRWYVRGFLAAPFCSAALVLVVAWRMDVGLTKAAAAALMQFYLAGLLTARGLRRAQVQAQPV